MTLEELEQTLEIPAELNMQTILNFEEQEQTSTTC